MQPVLGLFDQERHFDGHAVRIGQVEVGRAVDGGAVVGERRRSRLGPPAFHVEDVIGGDAVEPGAELALALERAELGDDLDQHFLGDLLGVVRLEDHADGDVVNPRLVPQDQLLQRRPVAAVRLRDQIGILGIVFSDFGEGVEHGSAPLRGE